MIEYKAITKIAAAGRKIVFADRAKSIGVLQIKVAWRCFKLRHWLKRHFKRPHNLSTEVVPLAHICIRKCDTCYL